MERHCLGLLSEFVIQVDIDQHKVYGPKLPVLAATLRLLQDRHCIP